ncbi:MAG: phospholipase, partial [Acidobacteriota bacterium]
MTRRELMALGLAGVFSKALAAADAPPSTPSDTAKKARLLSRPGSAPSEKTSVQPGLQELGLGRRRDGLLYVPAGFKADKAAPLVVLFHGAGMSAKRALGPLQPLADGAGMILLAIDSRGETWDVVEGGFGPDIAFLDRALELVFSRCLVDPARIAAEGFSDGASYALSIGV